MGPSQSRSLVFLGTTLHMQNRFVLAVVSDSAPTRRSARMAPLIIRFSEGLPSAPTLHTTVRTPKIGVVVKDVLMELFRLEMSKFLASIPVAARSFKTLSQAWAWEIGLLAS